MLPDAEYQHRLKLQRVEPADYFRPWDASGTVVQERRRWIEEFPERHCLALPAAEPLLEETLALAGMGLSLLLKNLVK